MVFSSLEFIFVFLPIFIIIYYISPDRFKNYWLLIASLGFYLYGTRDEPLRILLLLSSIIINYLLGLAIGKLQKEKKLLLILGLAYNLSLLSIFKYTNLLLPIGISFFTFQLISYLVDVYKGRIKPEKSFINLATYVSMFPKLTSGPLVSYNKINKQLKERKHSLKRFDNGLKTFTLGLGLKVLLANQIGNIWTDISAIGYESISTPLAWMGIIGFSLQIYFDFYGYSLIAIGLGEMIGFHLPDNFNYPYLSLTMTDFWRRWHITLGAWFRDYVYIPLGGNRKGSFKTTRNLLAVWLLTGMWHGSSLNFIIWGFSLFVIITIEKLGLGKILEKYKLLGRIYMILFIPLTWLVFAITDFSQLNIYFNRLFPFFKDTAVNVFEHDYIKYGKMYGVLLIIGILFTTKIPRIIYEKIKDSIFASALLLIIFWLSIYFLYMGLNDPFLYFRF